MKNILHFQCEKLRVGTQIAYIRVNEIKAARAEADMHNPDMQISRQGYSINAVISIHYKGGSYGTFKLHL